MGCSGWFYWHWKGPFYPEDVPTHRWFRHYVTHFKTVELNAPFYSWPKVSTVKTWKRNAPEDFRYAVKVNGIITHEKRMVRTKTLVKEFYSIAEILGPPSILSTEDEAIYYDAMARFARDISPKDRGVTITHGPRRQGEEGQASGQMASCGRP